MLDIETTLNNRPLSYLEDDTQFPVFTPNTYALGKETFNLEEGINMIEGKSSEKSEVCQEVQGYHMEQMERKMFETITRKIQHEM